MPFIHSRWGKIPRIIIGVYTALHSPLHRLKAAAFDRCLCISIVVLQIEFEIHFLNPASLELRPKGAGVSFAALIPTRMVSRSLPCN